MIWPARRPRPGRSRTSSSSRPASPGVRSDTVDGTERSRVSPSFRGEGQEGNNWLVDGLSVRGTRTRDQGVAGQLRHLGGSPDHFRRLHSGPRLDHGRHHQHRDQVRRQRLPRRDRRLDPGLASEGRPAVSTRRRRRSPTRRFISITGISAAPFIKDRLWFFLSDNFNRRMDDSERGIHRLAHLPCRKEKAQHQQRFRKTLPVARRQPHLGRQRHSGQVPQVRPEAPAFRNDTPRRIYKDWAYRVNYKGILSTDMFIEAAFGQSNQDSID